MVNIRLQILNFTLDIIRYIQTIMIPRLISLYINVRYALEVFSGLFR